MAINWLQTDYNLATKWLYGGYTQCGLNHQNKWQRKLEFEHETLSSIHGSTSITSNIERFNHLMGSLTFTYFYILFPLFHVLVFLCFNSLKHQQTMKIEESLQSPYDDFHSHQKGVPLPDIQNGWFNMEFHPIYI